MPQKFCQDMVEVTHHSEHEGEKEGYFLMFSEIFPIREDIGLFI
jgi:hypothetical protein